MFKAFTESVSSFIGSSESEKKPNGTGDSTQPTVPESDGVQTGATATNVAEEMTNPKPEVSTERRDSKVPPPRPAPPLTPANSISKAEPPESPNVAQATTTDTATTVSEQNTGTIEIGEPEEHKKDKIDEKLDVVAEKAKEWGSYFFSMTKSAGASVSAKAKELKKAVQETSIIGDFAKEQDKFVSEKKEKARAKEAAVPPWVGYNEEEQMKEQMLALSNDKRNFLRNPPSGVQFYFDYETCFPVAMATLDADEKLQKMRFALVPKQVNEHDFWRNYFYRVSLIKQSTQLTSLAKQNSSSNMLTSEAENEQTTPNIVNNSEVDQDKTKPTSDPSVGSADLTDMSEDADAAAVGQDEFVSDAYNLEISDEDLIKEMEALRASPGTDEWSLIGDADGELTTAEEDLESAIMAEMHSMESDLK